MAETGPGKHTTAQQASTVDGWLSTQPSPNTRSAYRSDVAAFGRWCAAEGVLPLAADTATLVAFQAARQLAGDSDATLRRRWSALSSFYEFAVDRQLASTNPTVGVDRPKVLGGDPSSTAQLSADAVASIRALAASLDPRLDALVALLVSGGLKMGEALALDIGDISGTGDTGGTGDIGDTSSAGKRAKATIRVRRRGEQTQVVLDRDTTRAVRRCAGNRRSGPLFVSERGSASVAHRLTRFGADHLIRQLRRDATNDGVTANALRRFHITTRNDEGDDIDEIRSRSGLADARSVRRYIRPAQ